MEVKELEEGKKYELISALCSGKEGTIKGVIEVGTNNESISGLAARQKNLVQT